MLVQLIGAELNQRRVRERSAIRMQAETVSRIGLTVARMPSKDGPSGSTGVSMSSSLVVDRRNRSTPSSSDAGTQP